MVDRGGPRLELRLGCIYDDERSRRALLARMELRAASHLSSMSRLQGFHPFDFYAVVNCLGNGFRHSVRESLAPPDISRSILAYPPSLLQLLWKTKPRTRSGPARIRAT